jgi:hypothetical protein
VKILAVSDEVIERLYSLSTGGHFSDVELILGCGDLPYPYLENLISFLNVPLYRLGIMTQLTPELTTCTSGSNLT